MLDILGQLDIGSALGLLILAGSPIDLLFYGLAVYEVWRFWIKK